LRYRLAETSVLQGNHQTAATILTALQQQDVDTALRAWVTLRLGNVHDLRGEHQAAQALYSQVQADTPARQLARRYLSHPFKPGRAKLKRPEETI
jgi:TolA-binding protein